MDTRPRIFSAQYRYFKQGSWRGLHRHLDKAKIFDSSLCSRVPLCTITPVPGVMKTPCLNTCFSNPASAPMPDSAHKQAKFKNCKYQPRRAECLQVRTLLAYVGKVSIFSTYKNCAIYLYQQSERYKFQYVHWSIAHLPVSAEMTLFTQLSPGQHTTSVSSVCTSPP